MLLPFRRLSFVRPVSRIWIRSSHELARPAQETSQKIYRARVNILLLGADRLLLTPRADTLESYLMTKLSDTKFYNIYRSTAFTRLIWFCLERHLFDVALALHDRRLKEGFLATHSLSLRMSALDVVRKAKNLRGIIPPLKKLFEQKPYDVTAFMDLVHYLTDDEHAPGALVDDLAHAFVSARQIRLSEYPDLVGLLASVNMRADRLDAAQSWLQVFEDVCGAQGILPDVSPYSDIIGTINEIDPKNNNAIQDVLVRMRSAGVAPDASVFNALIRANLVQKRYQEAFALYHILMEKRSDDLVPNDVTYKMLFQATNVLRHPRLARRRPENAIPPRRLFREMLACHLEQTKGRPSGQSTVISVSAFHLAFRTFMAGEDYAAAFIAIRALPAFSFYPNLKTYLIVFVNLLHRMRYEANLPRSEGSYCLVDFLTHLRPDEEPDLYTLMDRIHHHQSTFQRTTPSAIGIETVSHLLSLANRARSTEDDLPEVPALPRFPLQRHAQMPTAVMLAGAEKLPPNQYNFFSPVPLARIVYKALLGELFCKAVLRDVNWDWRGAVEPILEEAQREMIPEGGLGYEAPQRRNEGVLPFAAARMKRRKRSARGGREIVLNFEN